METNSNLVSAVEGLLKSRTDGVTFVEPSEDMWVQAETDAVRKAVCRALNDNDYRRLRRDAVQGVVKLSFSVKVDLDKHLCDAVMSGNIKLTNDARVLFENPAQLKLDL